jgi:hypothetical protein
MSYSPFFRGSNAKGSVRNLQSGYQNGTGGTLAQGTPVTVNLAGQLVAVDVSNDAMANGIVGLVAADIPVSASGQVLDNGRLENVSMGFNVGDILYVSKSGFLTNIIPDYGVGGFAAGDWIIFVGVVVQNEFNALQKDIVVSISSNGT